jgi:hypothetical protein
MLKFFGGASHAQDQTTPKATDQRNPFDLLGAGAGASASSSAASSRKASIAPATTPGAPGARTPVRPSLSHAASSTRSLGSNAGSEPATPGVTPGGSSRAQPTTGAFSALSSQCRSPMYCGTKERYEGQEQARGGAAEGSAEEAPRLRQGHGTRQQESSHRTADPQSGQLDLHTPAACMANLDGDTMAPLPLPRGATHNPNQETARLTPIFFFAFALAPRRSSGPYHLAPPRPLSHRVSGLSTNIHSGPLPLDLASLLPRHNICLTRPSCGTAHVVRLSPTATRRPRPTNRTTLHRRNRHYGTPRPHRPRRHAP